MDRCDQCGFVYDEVERRDALVQLLGLPASYGAVLRPAEAEGRARRRPDADTWSALEYTCHVRDVLRVQADRIAAALDHDRPTFAPMGREELVVSEAYNEQDVEVVLTALGRAAAAFVERCAELDEPDWHRTGIYTWPTEAERSLDWLLRHTLHEGRHHLDDVAEVVARVSG